MRVHFTTRSPIGPTHPDIAAAVEHAAGVLSRLGHHVEEATLPPLTLESFLPLWQHLISSNPLVRWHRAQPITRWLADAGRALRPRDVRATEDALLALLRPCLDGPDIWLTPTVAQPPPPVGAFEGDPEEGFRRAAELGAFTAGFNVTGQPAASVPLGLTREGLPMGLQVGGRLYAEGDVLAVCRQLEGALPWRDRVAPSAAAASD